MTSTSKTYVTNMEFVPAQKCRQSSTVLPSVLSLGQLFLIEENDTILFLISIYSSTHCRIDFSMCLERIKTYCLLGFQGLSCFAHPPDAPHLFYKLRKGCLSSGLDRTRTQQMLLLLALLSEKLTQKGYSPCVDNHIDLYTEDITCLNKIQFILEVQNFYVYDQGGWQVSLCSSVKNTVLHQRNHGFKKKPNLHHSSGYNLTYSVFLNRHWTRKVAMKFQKWLQHWRDF